MGKWKPEMLSKYENYKELPYTSVEYSVFLEKLFLKVSILSTWIKSYHFINLIYRCGRVYNWGRSGIVVKNRKADQEAVHHWIPGLRTCHHTGLHKTSKSGESNRFLDGFRFIIELSRFAYNFRYNLSSDSYCSK